MPEITGAIPEFLPPTQRPGESAAEYIERAEWHRARVPADVLYAPIRGAVAGNDGIKPWQKADYIGRAGTLFAQRENPNVFNKETVVVPQWHRDPVRRRSPMERMNDIRGMLQALAIQSYAGGIMRLPHSINEKLVRLGVYKTYEDATKDTVEDACRKMEAYGQALLEAAKSNGVVASVSTVPQPASTLDVAV